MHDPEEPWLIVVVAVVVGVMLIGVGLVIVL